MNEINDHRAKLVAEIVYANENGYLTDRNTFRLIDDVIFKDKPFGDAYSNFWQSAKEKRKLHRLLRGYSE